MSPFVLSHSAGLRAPFVFGVYFGVLLSKVVARSDLPCSRGFRKSMAFLFLEDAREGTAVNGGAGATVISGPIVVATEGLGRATGVTGRSWSIGAAGVVGVRDGAGITDNVGCGPSRGCTYDGIVIGRDESGMDG